MCGLEAMASTLSPRAPDFQRDSRQRVVVKMCLGNPGNLPTGEEREEEYTLGYL